MMLSFGYVGFTGGDLGEDEFMDYLLRMRAASACP
jgi:hypothetical protein